MQQSLALLPGVLVVPHGLLTMFVFFCRSLVDENGLFISKKNDCKVTAKNQVENFALNTFLTHILKVKYSKKKLPNSQFS